MLVLVNPKAVRFAPDRIREVLEERLTAHGVTHRILLIPADDRGGFVAREVARALGEGCRRVIAAGGDGTVALVAAALVAAGGMPQDATLGIIPAGTANVLAHELGLPEDLEGAAAVIETGQALELDAIRIGERHFLTQIGIGPDALMIRDTAGQGKRRRLGRVAYMLSFARRALQYRARRIRLDIDGVERRVQGWQIVVANVGALGAPPFTWGPGIDPTDGELDLCIYHVGGLRELLGLVLRVIAGRHRRDARQQFHRIRERARIESDRALPVQGDGEPIGHTPIELSVARGWIRVLVPDPTGGAPPATPGEAVAAIPSEAPPPAPSPGEVHEPETVAAEVEQMVAEHSRTWLLQGPLSHPLTALGALDAALFLRLNRLPLGTRVDHALSVISRLMHYGEGWIAVAAIAIAVDRAAGLRVVAQAVPVLWLTMLTVNFPLKALFRRRRPFLAFVDARVVGARPRDFSFPSGHTAAGFAGALLFATHFPAAAPAFYALALIVAFSRIYLGVHYPSDVVIGAAIGTLLAAAFRALLLAVFPGLA